jgi:tryptophan synthase alpha subunit
VDGVIVGSALIDVLEKAPAAERTGQAVEFVKSLLNQNQNRG